MRKIFEKFRVDSSWLLDQTCKTILAIFQNTHHNTTSKQTFKNIETSFQKDKHLCKKFKQELLQRLPRQGIFFKTFSKTTHKAPFQTIEKQRKVI